MALVFNLVSQQSNLKELPLKFEEISRVMNESVERKEFGKVNFFIEKNVEMNPENPELHKWKFIRTQLLKQD